MSQALLKEDLAALDCAERNLSALIVGEKQRESADFGPVYARITGYFAKYDGPKLGNVEMMKHVARMFMTITTAPTVTGFQAQEYESLIKVCRKTARAKHPFMRRGAKKCNRPNEHRQPCYCARAEKAREAQEREWVADQPLKTQIVQPKALPPIKEAEIALKQKLIAENAI